MSSKTSMAHLLSIWRRTPSRRMRGDVHLRSVTPSSATANARGGGAAGYPAEHAAMVSRRGTPGVREGEDGGVNGGGANAAVRLQDLNVDVELAARMNRTAASRACLITRPAARGRTCGCPCVLAALARAERGHANSQRTSAASSWSASSAWAPRAPYTAARTLVLPGSNTALLVRVGEDADPHHVPRLLGRRPSSRRPSRLTHPSPSRNQDANPRANVRRSSPGWTRRARIHKMAAVRAAADLKVGCAQISTKIFSPSRGVG